MGCQHSKQKKSQRKSKIEEEPKNVNCEDASDAAIIKKYDREMINTIKKDLNESPETFVLNNVLMCTIFLRNYQDDMQPFRYKEWTKGKFWEPDMIPEKANKNVVYRPMHGAKKDIAEPLVKKRIYVPLNNYIQVYSPLDDVENVGSNSSSMYQVKIEESKRHGYVKLRRLNARNHDGNSMKDVPVLPSSNNSASSDTESTCTSAGMVVKENPQLIKDQNDEIDLDDCFVYRKVKKPDIDLDLEDMDHENLKEEDIYDVVSYLPSRKFMKYFQSRVFRETIAEKLGLIKYEIDNAIVDEHIPGKIFCNLRDDNGNCYPVEVMPCLKFSWPSKQTYEFLNGKTSFEKEKGSFQWPTKRMLNGVKEFDCALVPKGYSRKRGQYPEGDLEWEIHFPIAEGCFQSQLRPEQIKCYLVLVSIYKEYLEPYTKGHGIVPEHLLNLILWESERNFDSWPEHRLGIRLISIIQNFSTMLSQRMLRDYFIRKKNILKTISRKYLEYANEVFHKIQQSPVMSIIRALRNVRYTSGKYYPPLNYKELLDILYKKDWDENPYVSSLTLNYADTSSLSSTSEKKPKFNDPEKQLQYVKEKETKRKLMQKRKKQNDVKILANLSYNVNLEVRRESSDSVNDDWKCEKRFDRQKKIALLKFFIKNYLDIAQTKFQIGSKRQTMFYLKQAWYLTKILQEENQLFAEEVVEFFKIIKEQEDKVIGVMQTNKSNHGHIDVSNSNYDKEKELDDDLATLDDLPQNGFIGNKANHVNAEIHQQIRQTKINLNSLSRSFNSNHSLHKSTETFES